MAGFRERETGRAANALRCSGNKRDTFFHARAVAKLEPLVQQGKLSFLAAFIMIVIDQACRVVAGEAVIGESRGLGIIVYSNGAIEAWDG